MKAGINTDSTLERDMHSKAILNKNRYDYERRIQQKTIQEQRNTELTILRSEVAELKQIVSRMLADRSL